MSGKFDPEKLRVIWEGRPLAAQGAPKTAYRLQVQSYDGGEPRLRIQRMYWFDPAVRKSPQESDPKEPCWMPTSNTVTLPGDVVAVIAREQRPAIMSALASAIVAEDLEGDAELRVAYEAETAETQVPAFSSEAYSFQVLKGTKESDEAWVMWLQRELGPGGPKKVVHNEGGSFLSGCHPSYELLGTIAASYWGRPIYYWCESTFVSQGEIKCSSST